LSSSPSIIRIIKSMGMRWAGNLARTGESRNAYRLWVAKPESKRPQGRHRRGWEKILEWILERHDAVV
jgi:hypothetical protein